MNPLKTQIMDLAAMIPTLTFFAQQENGPPLEHAQFDSDSDIDIEST